MSVIDLSGRPVPPKGTPNEVLIQVLRNVLAKAESGQLQSFIGTGFTHDGLRLSCWGPMPEDVYQMLGSIAWLEHEFVERVTTGVWETPS